MSFFPQELLARITYIPKTIKLIWSAARFWMLGWCLLLLIQGLIPIFTVYLTRWLVDNLTIAIGKGNSWSNLEIIILPASLMASILFLAEILKGIGSLIRMNLAELVKDRISAMVHHQSVTIDLACYESPEYYNLLNRIRGGASDRTLSLMESIGGLLQNSITLLSMMLVIMSYGFWLPLVLIASALPTFYVALRLNRDYYQWWSQTTTQRRWLEYQEQLLTHSMSAPEMRIFALGNYFQSAYQKLRQQLRIEQIELSTRQSFSRLGANIAGFLIIGVALVWILQQALLGTVTLGDLALFYQALNKSQGLMRSVLDNLNQIHQNNLFITDLFKFFELQPSIVNPPQPEPIPTKLNHNIEFKNVTFRYRGSHQPVLKDFNLTIPAGKIVAIVGDNGAGKSTLTKLLCRFYDPEAGRIELGGVDIRNFSLEELRRQITILFQFPVPYYLTAAKSIALGDIFQPPNLKKIKAAAHIAGAQEILESLPQGYDSQLGKSFPDGTDLSGGEWQRLALARAFYRQAPIIILDEPTSAMDPWAEIDWLKRFRAVAQERTSILITHRFTLAMQADIIHVMRDGQIIESGSHKYLIHQHGLYAQSWSAQTENIV
ncbi:MAG: ABC transporter ATP-binding protein [Cyanobacteria bacterium P01_A01_bin.83]